MTTSSEIVNRVANRLDGLMSIEQIDNVKSNFCPNCGARMDGDKE